MINLATQFGTMSNAMRPCSKCGVSINYQKFDNWPDLGPNLCDPCGRDFEQTSHDNAIKKIQTEMIEASKIPVCYDNWDNAKSVELSTNGMFHWLTNSGISMSTYWGGKNGVGKTHTVCYAALSIIRANRMAIRFYSCSRWLTTMMQLKVSDLSMFNKEAEIAATCNIAIFDDIGKEKPTEAKIEVLSNIMDLREQQKKPTWFTSNYNIDELSERFGDNYGNAIKVRVERLCGTNVVS